MKGLLLKDTYLMAKVSRMFLVLVLMFLAFWTYEGENLFFLSYPFFLSTMVPMTLISYDERDKWDVFAGTLPYSRAQMVSSKYLLGICLGVLVFAIASLVLVICRGAAGFWETFPLLPVLLSVGLVAAGLLYPFIFWLGSEKGRVFYYVIIGVVCGGSALLQFVDVASLANLLPGGNLPAVVLTAVLAGAAVYAASWLVSIRLYTRREL